MIKKPVKRLCSEVWSPNYFVRFTKILLGRSLWEWPRLGAQLYHKCQWSPPHQTSTCCQELGSGDCCICQGGSVTSLARVPLEPQAEKAAAGVMVVEAAAGSSGFLRLRLPGGSRGKCPAIFLPREFAPICVCRRGHVVELWESWGIWLVHLAMNTRGPLFPGRIYGRQQDRGWTVCTRKRGLVPPTLSTREVALSPGAHLLVLPALQWSQATGKCSWLEICLSAAGSGWWAWYLDRAWVEARPSSVWLNGKIGVAKLGWLIFNFLKSPPAWGSSKRVSMW